MAAIVFDFHALGSKPFTLQVAITKAMTASSAQAPRPAK
jgi:hypothetical protein